MKADNSTILIKSIIKRLKAAEADGTIKNLDIKVEEGSLIVKYE